MNKSQLSQTWTKLVKNVLRRKSWQLQKLICFNHFEQRAEGDVFCAYTGDRDINIFLEKLFHRIVKTIVSLENK